jgi:hypothetical protein
VQTVGDRAPVFPGVWNRDGVILFQGSGGGLSSVAATGGVSTPLGIGRSAPALHPGFLPDGSRFFYSITQGPANPRGVYVGTLGFRKHGDFWPAYHERGICAARTW